LFLAFHTRADARQSFRTGKMHVLDPHEDAITGHRASYSRDTSMSKKGRHGDGPICQRGGFVVVAQPSGDSSPSMTEAGRLRRDPRRASKR
jgi:hypothetical protein